jgi:hypothetical protein
MNDWRNIYSTDSEIRATLVRGVLEDREIPAIVINKRDSQYNDFGELEVYVHQENVLIALKIIKNELEFE